jgi:hypothetical protein
MGVRNSFQGVYLLERDARRRHHEAIAIGLRFIGRLCLIGAAMYGGFEIFNALTGEISTSITLRMVLDLSPYRQIIDIWFMQRAADFILDTRMWVLLLVFAALPYFAAVSHFAAADD